MLGMFHSVAVDELGESAAFIVADAFRHITAVGAQGVGYSQHDLCLRHGKEL